MTIIALVGTYVGTFIGILFQFMSGHIPQIVISLGMPSISSYLFISIYIYLNKKGHQD
jgi:hypothetical protein